MTSRISIKGNNNIVVGRDLVISNGRVIVDGKDLTPNTKEIVITIEGNVQSLSVDACSNIKVSGNVGSLQTSTGDVYCGDVQGSVSTKSGDIECGSVGGNASSMSGDIDCKSVNGNVSTMSGDITRR